MGIGHPGSRGSPEPFSPIPNPPLLDQTALPDSLQMLGLIRGLRGPQPACSRIRGSHMMKKIQAASAVALALSSVSFAQQAVQWKVSDGGNGHWYELVLTPTWVDFAAASSIAAQRGGHLLTGCGSEFDAAVTITGALSPQAWQLVPPNQWLGPWIGLQLSGNMWGWVDGTTCAFDRWDTSRGQPDWIQNSPDGETVAFLYTFGPTPLPRAHDVTILRATRSLLIEWSADCNGDGIVDYGQCHDGSLPDYNGNNIPDCCEAGSACVVGNYPVEWRIAEGGNGHWYAVDLTPLWWDPWNQRAASLGAQLASVTSLSEQRHVVSLIGPMTKGGYPQLLWLGALRRQCSWSWTSGEPWNFTSWAPGNPNGGCIDAQLGIFANQTQPEYNLGWDDCICPSNGEPTAAVLEWSADCNNDGLVDKGQILRGQLADSDNDGIPNVCDCACDVFRDFNVNGIDLGILLGQWGPANQFTVTDFNQDGSVDGSDLGVLLGAWGPCPN